MYFVRTGLASIRYSRQVHIAFDARWSECGSLPESLPL